MNKTLASLAVAALMALGATSANAVVYTFNASLKSANEVSPASSNALATGTAILDYDTHGTGSLADDTYRFSMAVFDLTGGTISGVPGYAARAFHIHGAASTTENGPVRVSLDALPFVNTNLAGLALMVAGNNVAAPAIPATLSNPAQPNAGYPAMSFLDLLRGGLAYVNVHTDAHPGGAVRGQLIEVSAVPEPSTYAMLLAGLAVLGFAVRRRQG